MCTSLRHNLATWLILAYELAKNPEMAQYSNILQDHPLFEPQRSNALLNFCNWTSGNHPVDEHLHHFAVLAALIGHGDIQTTFQHYFHGHCVLTRYHLNQLVLARAKQ